MGPPPRASGREAGTRPPPRRKRSGSGSWRGGDTSGACHVAYRLRAGDSGRRAGRGQPACTGWTRRRPAPQGCVGGAPPEPGCRAAGPPAPFRPHLDLAGYHRRAVRAPRPDHACRPLHLGSVHLEKHLFLEIATGSVRYRGGAGGGRLQSYKLLEGRACGTK